MHLRFKIQDEDNDQLSWCNRIDLFEVFQTTLSGIRGSDHPMWTWFRCRLNLARNLILFLSLSLDSTSFYPFILSPLIFLLSILCTKIRDYYIFSDNRKTDYNKKAAPSLKKRIHSQFIFSQLLVYHLCEKREEECNKKILFHHHQHQHKKQKSQGGEIHSFFM